MMARGFGWLPNGCRKGGFNGGRRAKRQHARCGRTRRSYCSPPVIRRRKRRRVVTAKDIAFIRQLIAENPRASRRRLSAQLCKAWEWRQANGALRDMVCRGLLLMLHRAGEIALPPIRFRTLNPFVRRVAPAPMLIDTSPIAGALRALRPIDLQQVRRTSDEPLFNSLLEQYHYLTYEQPVGEHLKYLVWAQGRPIACVAWSSAPRHLGSRDRYIGWSAEARRRNIRFIGHGRNGAARYQGARKIPVPHASLKTGDPCPDLLCRGKVYPLRAPGVLVRHPGTGSGGGGRV